MWNEPWWDFVVFHGLDLCDNLSPSQEFVTTRHCGVCDERLRSWIHSWWWWERVLERLEHEETHKGAFLPPPALVWCTCSVLTLTSSTRSLRQDTILNLVVRRAAKVITCSWPVSVPCTTSVLSKVCTTSWSVGAHDRVSCIFHFIRVLRVSGMFTHRHLMSMPLIRLNGTPCSTGPPEKRWTPN